MGKVIEFKSKTVEAEDKSAELFEGIMEHIEAQQAKVLDPKEYDVYKFTLGENKSKYGDYGVLKIEKADPYRDGMCDGVTSIFTDKCTINGKMLESVRFELESDVVEQGKENAYVFGAFKKGFVFPEFIERALKDRTLGIGFC